MALSAIVLFSASALRHHAFRSGAMDLGFFDQLTYLISQGKQPVSSILGYHLLGDHAAYILYLIAPLYWIWPNVHMLLVAQAIALASGGYPVYRLALTKHLSQRQALSLAGAYLMYPVVLTANLFDFHPEVISVAALLFAVMFAMERRTAGFVIALAVALGGKEIISLTVLATGVWLALFERRRLHGAIAIVLGAAWFIIATQLVIPHFGAGKEASGVRFFAYLGSSVTEIAKNIVIQPQRWMNVVLSIGTIKYLFILCAPVAWALVPRRREWPRYLLPLLVCATPTLAMNILAQTNEYDLKYPFAQYSLMVVPFLAITFVYAVAAKQAWLIRPRSIAMWSFALVLLGVGARLTMMKPEQAGNLASVQATREALAHIPKSGAVLTTHEIAPHLSQRSFLQFVDPVKPRAPIERFDYVLLNLSNESAKNASALTAGIFERVKSDPAFSLQFQRDSVYLFTRNNNDTARAE